MNSALRHSALFLVLVVSSCAGGMGTTGGSPLGTTEKGGEEDVSPGEIGVQDQISAPVPTHVPVAGSAPVQEQFPGTSSASPVSAIGQGSLAPGLEAPTGPTATSSPTGQIFGIPITAGGGVGSATPTDVPVDEEGEGTSDAEPEISYHYSTAAPAEEVLPTLPATPSLETNPIVVCAPDTICYQEDEAARLNPPCSMKELENEKITVTVFKKQVSNAREKPVILIEAQITVGKYKELERQCLVEISQPDWKRMIGTNHSGVFGLFIHEFQTSESDLSEGGGEEKKYAEFEIQVYSTDEEPMPLGESVLIEVEVPVMKKIAKPSPPKKTLKPKNGPSKKPATGKKTDKEKDQKKPVIVPLKLAPSISYLGGMSTR